MDNTAAALPLDMVSELNNMVSKPYIKVSAMEFGRQYKVLNVSRCSTKFGAKVSLELEDVKIFLPCRYDKLSDAALQSINVDGNIYINNEGPNSNKSFNLKFCRASDLQQEKPIFYAPLF